MERGFGDSGIPDHAIRVFVWMICFGIMTPRYMSMGFTELEQYGFILVTRENFGAAAESFRNE